MITLHNTTEFAKKAGMYLGIGLGVIIMITIFFKVGKTINAMLNPPKIPPPNEAYGKLPPLTFPQSTVRGQFTYTINTTSGSLPQGFPDRLIIYPTVISQPNLLNLDNTKSKVASLGFVDNSGNTVAEIPRGGANYEWDELGGFQRKIVFDIVSQNFTMTSNYLTALSVGQAQYIQQLTNPTDAIPIVQNFLGTISSMPSDIDMNLTQNPDPNNAYTTSPQLFTISQGGQLVPTTSLSSAQVIRVDLYQGAVSYTLTAGLNQDPTQFQDFNMSLPIVYPHPPYSTMNFLVASGDSEADIVSAIFNHQTVNLQPSTQATYPIKSAQEAFDELKSGKGYIAAYNGTESQIQISNVFPAYYLGNTQQQYLMPIIVFQGQDGFFAYVPAVTSDSLQ